MTKKDFLLLLDELFELSPGTLRGGEMLGEDAKWDSITVLGFLALADEQFSAEVSPKAIAEAKTVNDLVGFVAPHLED